MKIELYLSQPELQDPVIQALSDARLLDKVDLRILPDSCQSKSSQPRGLTSIRNCNLVRMADNTLECSACGRKFPSTREGDLDLEKLEHEIALRQW